MKLLSLFLCLAMLLSGFAFAEEPVKSVSTVVNVRDAVLTINEEEYPLNPSLTFGFSADDHSALIDFGMPLGEKVLFPVQAKIDENGAAILLGDSDTAYTFSPEFFTSAMEEMDIPAEAIALLTSYGDLIRAAVSLENTAALELDPAFEEKLGEMVTAAEGEEAQFEANGETQTGTTYALSMDADQIHELLDYSFAQLPADFTEAYFGYINAMFALVGGPEISTFGELLDLAGMDISLSGEMIANETSAAGEIMFHLVVDPSEMYEGLAASENLAVMEETSVEIVEEASETAEKEPAVESDELSVGIIGGADGPTSMMVTGVVSSEPVSIDIPMEIVVHNPEYVECAVDMEIEGMNVSVATAMQGEDYNTSVFYDIPDVGTVSAYAAAYPEEDGSMYSAVSVYADLGDGQIAFASEGSSVNGESACDVSFAVISEELSAELSFVVEQTNEAFTDRIAQAQPKVINSLEEAENSIGLMMAAMGMVGDVEALMNDESIAPIVEMFTTMLLEPAIEPAYESEEYTYEEAVESVTFAAPELNWLPEGYQIVESEMDEEYGMYSATLARADDEYLEHALYLNVYAYESPSQQTQLYSINGSEISPVEGILVHFNSSDDVDFPMNNAYANLGNCDIDLYCYSNALTADDLLNVIAGISFAE